MPPELASFEAATALSDEAVWGDDFSAIRCLYRRQLESQTEDTALDKRLVESVLQQARAVIAHPSRPRECIQRSFVENPHGELELEASVDQDPSLSVAESLVVEDWSDKHVQCVAVLDCSSSMSGDKHLLASIAVAVLSLELPQTSGLVTFSSDGSLIKPLSGFQSLEMTLLKFLRVRPRGFTNIAKGLELALSQSMKKKVGLLASDGRQTEGVDPLDMARRFDTLIVLHLHGSGSDLESSKKLAQAGHGHCIEVGRYEELPRRMYESLRLLMR